MASQEWHWEQGAKFAVEGIKTTLLLNGAAAIALMTFATNAQKFSSLLISPLLSFVAGASLSAFAFLAAYMAQLEYGNGEQSGIGDQNRAQIWKRAQHWNQWAVLTMLASIVAFGLGITFAAFALPKLTAG